MVMRGRSDSASTGRGQAPALPLHAFPVSALGCAAPWGSWLLVTVSECLVRLPFAVNGELSSPVPADGAPAVGPSVAPQEGVSSSGYTGTTGEEAPVPEVSAASEPSGCVLLDGAALGSGTGGGPDSDPAASASGNSPAFDAAKPRQPSGTAEPGRNAGAESLPSGYVPPGVCDACC